MAEPGRVYTGAAMPVSARTSQAPSRTASNGYPQTKALSPGQDQLWPAPAEGKRLKPRPEPVAILPAQSVSSFHGAGEPPPWRNVCDDLHIYSFHSLEQVFPAHQGRRM